MSTDAALLGLLRDIAAALRVIVGELARIEEAIRDTAPRGGGPRPS